MAFPLHRSRRLRQNANITRLVRETRLSVDDLIAPLFVCEGKGVRLEISAMPGVYRCSIDQLLVEVKEIHRLGIPGVILFGIPDKKDAVGSEAYNPDGIVQRAVREIKSAVPDLLVFTDVCIDEYTDHGHCGLVKDGRILNDPTLELLSRMAKTHADAGADGVAPSDMMDGRVGAIRKTLDETGHENTILLSYAAKFASAFYGPFREAADSTPKFGDRRTYQMDPGNRGESLKEVWQDIEEGADMVMHHPFGARQRQRSRGGLPCQRRIRHGEGRGPQWMGGWRCGHDGKPARHKTGGSTHDPYLFRSGGRSNPEPLIKRFSPFATPFPLAVLSFQEPFDNGQSNCL